MTGENVKRGRAKRIAVTDEHRHEDSYGWEKAYSESVGWTYRENCRKLGRVRQGEIARVEWQENERGWNRGK